MGSSCGRGCGNSKNVYVPKKLKENKDETDIIKEEDEEK